ncbi:MAG: phBC6A51 family helix-turn-helix protein [Candidatus Actinomarinaceae bacterium]
MSDIIKNPAKTLAIEMFATQPSMNIEEVAKRCNVPKETIYEWRRNDNFMELIYKRYMVKFGGDLPLVLEAALREAKAGNVQAMRLVLEHSGKLVKNVNVTIDSPFEKFLKKIDNIEDAEILDDDEVNDLANEALSYIPEKEDEEELPPRNEDSQRKRLFTEKKSLETSIREEKKRVEYNKKQKEWYNWKKRAKAVGVEPLKAKRPTKGQRVAWEKEIIAAEELKDK